MHDFSGEEIDFLKSRIAKMEQEIDGLRDNAADRGPATEAQIPGLAPAALISSVPAASKGSWAVNFESHTSEKSATAAVIRLRGQGINAEKHTHIKDGTTWYRIRVPGFSSSAEARAYAENILAKSGFSEAWIGRMQ
jgi:cell division protein FtsN